MAVTTGTLTHPNGVTYSGYSDVWNLTIKWDRTSTNTTTGDATIHYTGTVSISPTGYQTSIYYSLIKINGTTVYSNGLTNKVTTKNGMTLFSGNLTINCANADKTFTISAKVSTHGYNTTNCNYDLSQSYTLPAVYTYSQCGAPTSVSLSTGRVVPGGSATLSWSGATAGRNMSISGYHIYRDGSYLGAVSTSATSGSYTVYAPSSRGSSYRYQVYTIASVSGYNSGASDYSGYLYANQLPNTPSASGGKTVPSGGGTVTFTATNNGDPDGNTPTLYYAYSASGAKTQYTGSVTLTIKSNTTFYVWAYDGLEYSSAATSTATVNTKPTFSLSISGYTESDVTSTRTLSENLSISGYSFNKDPSSYDYKLNNSSYNPTTGSTSDSKYDASTWIKNCSNGASYTLSMRYHDGIEWSDWKTSSTYYRPNSVQAPTITSIKTDIATKDPNVDRSLQFNNSITYSANANNTGTGYAKVTLSYQFLKSNKKDQWSSLSAVPRGENVYIRVIATSYWSSNSVDSSMYRRINTPTLNNFSVEASISPFKNDSNNIDVSCGLVMGDSSQYKYTFTSIHQNYALNLSSADYQAKPSNNTISFKCSKTPLKEYYYYQNLYPSSIKPTFTLTVTDLYGNSVSVSFNESTVQLAEAPQLNNASINTKIEYKNGATYVAGSNLTTTSGNKARILNNGDKLKITLPSYRDLNSDSTQDYNDVLYYNIYGYYSDIREIETATTTLYFDRDTFPNLFEKNTDFYYQVPVSESTYEITAPLLPNNKFVYIFVNVQDRTGLTSKTQMIINEVIFAPVNLPQGQVSSIAIKNGTSDNKQFTLNYQISTYGQGEFLNKTYTYNDYPNLERKITSASDTTMPTKVVTLSPYWSTELNGNYVPLTSVTQTVSDTSGAIKLTFNKEILENIYVKLRIKVISGFDAQYSEVDTSPIIYYAAGPTIVPRPHRLGINSLDVTDSDTDAVLIIAGYDKYKKVIIKYEGTDPSRQDIVIDLSNGEISNALISGGTW